MKPLAIAWLALAVCLLAPVARAAELVPNGGFEEMKRSDLVAGLDPKIREFYGGIADSPFQGWAFGAQWEQGEYLVAVSGDAHSGKHSCQITCRKKGRGGIASSPIQLKAGTIIQVSFWAKAQEAMGGRIFLNLGGTPGDGWTHKDLRTGTYTARFNRWHKLFGHLFSGRSFRTGTKGAAGGCGVAGLLPHGLLVFASEPCTSARPELSLSKILDL